jgi:hypothetical protein
MGSLGGARGVEGEVYTNLCMSLLSELLSVEICYGDSRLLHLM